MVLEEYPVHSWRGFFEVAASWAVIGAAIGAVHFVSAWLYPVVALLIANRALALSLLCHEAVHGNLHRNRAVNDWLGRYLCGFPTLISLNKYRRLHLLHHATVGSERLDPDYGLYSFYPISPQRYASLQIRSLVSLKTSYDFLSYFTDWPDLFRSGRTLHRNSDIGRFAIFSLFAIAGIYFLEFHVEYLLFWIVPIFVLMQPYVLLMGGLQHGPPRNTSTNTSRSIVGSKWYMWILLPCDINFHAEHHALPMIPHYHLHRAALQLDGNHNALWRCSYWQAIRDLFSSPENQYPNSLNAKQI